MQTMKSDIARLIKAEQLAKQKEAQVASVSLLPSPAAAAPAIAASVVSNGSNSTAVQDTTVNATPRSLPPLLTNPPGAISPSRNLSILNPSIALPQARSADILLSHLQQCSAAVGKLASAVQKTADEWERNQTYESTQLCNAYDEMREALFDMSVRARKDGQMDYIHLQQRTKNPLQPPTSQPLPLYPDSWTQADIDRWHGKTSQPADASASFGDKVKGVLVVVAIVIATIATGGLILIPFCLLRRKRRGGPNNAANPEVGHTAYGPGSPIEVVDVGNTYGPGSPIELEGWHPEELRSAKQRAEEMQRRTMEMQSQMIERGPEYPVPHARPVSTSTSNLSEPGQTFDRNHLPSDEHTMTVDDLLARWTNLDLRESGTVEK
jgi:hypothetical protein